MGLALALGLFVVSDDVLHYLREGPVMFDAHAYWLTGQGQFDGYDRVPGQTDAYLYSPAFAQIIRVITWLPWPAFAILWFLLELMVFVWLLRPLGAAWTIVLLVWCLPELLIGNIYGFLAAAVVLALTRVPALWALPLLTKPSLGVGLIWHLVRREWWPLAVAIATTVGIVVVSYVLSPSLWRDWVDLLVAASSGASSVGLAIRLAAAALLIALGALRGWSWIVPFALLLALPLVGGPSVLSLLAAVPRLWLDGPSEVAAGAPPVVADEANDAAAG